MKQITIYKRTVTERTQFKKWRYKEVDQITIMYDGKTMKNHDEAVDNPRLKIKFTPVLTTRKKSDLHAYIEKLGTSNADKWQKAILNEIEVNA